MATVILAAILVPVVAGIALLAGRSRLPKIASDIRGIALQTVIIIVVLLAIAGAVAGVLLTRGSEATRQLENQQITVNYGSITNLSLCDAAGGKPVNAAGTVVTAQTDMVRCDPP